MDKMIKFEKCFFCDSDSLERFTPKDTVGVYARCKFCGSIVGVDKNSKNELYIYWRKQDPTNCCSVKQANKEMISYGKRC